MTRRKDVYSKFIIFAVTATLFLSLVSIDILDKIDHHQIFKGDNYTLDLFRTLLLFIAAIILICLPIVAIVNLSKGLIDVWKLVR